MSLDASAAQMNQQARREHLSDRDHMAGERPARERKRHHNRGKRDSSTAKKHRPASKEVVGLGGNPRGRRDDKRAPGTGSPRRDTVALKNFESCAGSH